MGGINAQKIKKTRKNLYITSTPQPMLVRAHRGLDSSRALQKKKKKSQNRENRKNKNRLQGSAYVFAWALRALDSAPHKSLSSSAFIHATQAHAACSRVFRRVGRLPR